MAQKRSPQSDQPPPGETAGRALVQLRSGRVARDAIARPANDNGASLAHRLARGAAAVAGLALVTALLWRWIA